MRNVGCISGIAGITGKYDDISARTEIWRKYEQNCLIEIQEISPIFQRIWKYGEPDFEYFATGHYGRLCAPATKVASGLLAIVICYSLIGQPVDSQFTLFLRF